MEKWEIESLVRKWLEIDTATIPNAFRTIIREFLMKNDLTEEEIGYILWLLEEDLGISKSVFFDNKRSIVSHLLLLTQPIQDEGLSTGLSRLSSQIYLTEPECYSRSNPRSRYWITIDSIGWLGMKGYRVYRGTEELEFYIPFSDIPADQMKFHNYQVFPILPRRNSLQEPRFIKSRIQFRDIKFINPEVTEIVFKFIDLTYTEEVLTWRSHF